MVHDQYAPVTAMALIRVRVRLTHVGTVSSAITNLRVIRTLLLLETVPLLSAAVSVMEISHAWDDKGRRVRVTVALSGDAENV